MAAVAPPTMTDTPPFPVLADRAAGTYNSKAFAFGTHMSDVFNDELEAMVDNAYANALDAASSATTANDAAADAETAASAAEASAASAVAAPGTAATSTTSLVVGTGSKSLTVQTGKAFSVGQSVVIADTAAPATNWMFGQVTSYNSGTGALVVEVVQVAGSGTIAAWTISVSASPAVVTPIVYGLKLLATLTPTAAANVDFLTAFSGTYDSYLVIGQGVCPSANDQLRYQLAVSGSADAGSNYYASGALSNTAITVATSSGTVTGNVGTGGKGCNFELLVQNANDAVNLKTGIAKSVAENNTPNNFQQAMYGVAYVAANAVSGIRFLWNSASNFKAQGTISIYGISKV